MKKMHVKQLYLLWCTAAMHGPPLNQTSCIFSARCPLFLSRLIYLYDYAMNSHDIVYRYVYGPQRTNPSYFGERLTFPVQPPAGLHLWSIVKYPDKCCMDCHEFCCRCSRTLSNKYVIVGTDMHGPKRRNCNNWTNWPANSSIESRYSCTETIAWQWTFKPNVNGFKCVHLTVFVNMFACGSRNQTWSWMLRD